MLEKPEACAPAPVSIDARITAALAAAARPVPLGELRHFCRVRHATLHERLRALTGAGHLLHDGAGYRLAANSAVTSPSSR